MSQIISKKNQIRSILFVLILMTITIIVILKEYSIKEVTGVIKSVHPFYLLAGILMMFLYVACQATILYTIFKKLEHQVSYGYCIEYSYVGNYFGAITPGASGSQPAQLYYMSKDKIHVDTSAITVFFVVLSNQVAILVLGCIFTILRRKMIYGLDRWLRYLFLAGSFVILGLILIILAIMFMKKTIPFLFRLVLKLGVRIRLVKQPQQLQVKFEALLLSYREKSRMILKNPELFLKVFLISILQWISYYMVSYLVYLSFGYREHSAVDLMASQSFVSVAAAAVPLPGSVGVAENAYMDVFGQFFNEKELPSAMILSRIINFYLPLFISFFVYLFVHFRVIKQKKLQK